MIIGLVGKKRSGKTEAALYLSKKLNIPSYAFATPLKALVTEMTGLNDTDKDNTKYYTGKIIDLKPLKKELFKWKYDQLTLNEIDHIKALEYYTCGELYRNMLQYIGTNIFRSRNSHHWCHKFHYDHKKETSFIVEDIRFKNEYYLIDSYKESNIYKISRDIVDDYDTHLSETELDTIKFDNKKCINNNTSRIVDYYNQLDKFFKLG